MPPTYSQLKQLKRKPPCLLPQSLWRAKLPGHTNLAAAFVVETKWMAAGWNCATALLWIRAPMACGGTGEAKPGYQWHGSTLGYNFVLKHVGWGGWGCGWVGGWQLERTSSTPVWEGLKPSLCFQTLREVNVCDGGQTSDHRSQF